MAETIKRGLNNSSSAGSATILHPVSLSAGFVVESGINVAETSMRVYKTIRFECIKIFDQNIVTVTDYFATVGRKSDQPKERRRWPPKREARSLKVRAKPGEREQRNPLVRARDEDEEDAEQLRSPRRKPQRKLGRKLVRRRLLRKLRRSRRRRPVRRALRRVARSQPEKPVLRKRRRSGPASPALDLRSRLRRMRLLRVRRLLSRRQGVVVKWNPRAAITRVPVAAKKKALR